MVTRGGMHQLPYAMYQLWSASLVKIKKAKVKVLLHLQKVKAKIYKILTQIHNGKNAI